VFQPPALNKELFLKKYLLLYLKGVKNSFSLFLVRLDSFYYFFPGAICLAFATVWN
jgi:hypothetical protein